MAIITFWNDIKGEAGKTAAIAAVSTYLAINNNYKILLFNTKYNDSTMEDCFWEYKSGGLYDLSNKTELESGIRGLYKAIASNKTSPEIITNYTKTIFKGRLEILTDRNVLLEKYLEQRLLFKEIAKIANQYYDLVFVDLDRGLDDDITRGILEKSDLIMVTLPQRIRQIQEFIKTRERNQVLKEDNVEFLLGRYDNKSKYNQRNLMRYLHTNKVYVMPYNTLFFEACNEGKVDDFFIKFRKTNKQDKNSIFVKSIKTMSDDMIMSLRQGQRKRY